MGRKGSWFSTVKKALSPDPKEKGDKKGKSKKKWFGKEKEVEEIKLEEVEEEQTKHAYSVAVATAVAAEAAIAAAHAAAEVVRLTTVNQFAGKSQEEVARIRVQTAFRGYLARRALRALRGLVRLKSLVDGPTAKRQTTNALKCMQTLSRVQSQISSRRIRMLEENRALQRQLMQKHAKELESLRRGEEWDDSLQSKERIEASLLSKYEAAIRRERALAYSYSISIPGRNHQDLPICCLVDPTNPQWGWSWLERWTGARPWESQSMSDKELKTDQMSVRSLSIAGGEIAKSFARHQLNSELPSSPSSQKLSHPSGYYSLTALPNQPLHMQSERNRRHSIAGSSIRDDESLASSPSVPSYMASTQSAKAKTRLQSPLGMENGTPEKGSGRACKEAALLSTFTCQAKAAFRPYPKFDNTSLNTSIAEDTVNGVVN
ncbi:IQ-domain [Datura stramonium]|uniref:IQ-domain n=1 Tax=Datura stramonium TaxID=4076 RepID=A0ABS8SUZ7_DATST|nr:IQ-domain [Datura stramonium]